MYQSICDLKTSKNVSQEEDLYLKKLTRELPLAPTWGPAGKIGPTLKGGFNYREIFQTFSVSPPKDIEGFPDSCPICKI